MNPQNYGHLSFDKGATTIQWKTDILFNKWCWFNWRSACKRMQIHPFLSPCTKVNDQDQVDQEPPHKTRHTDTNRKKLEKSLEHMGTGEIFLNRTLIAYALRSRIDKWDLIKLQSFCKAKDTVNRTKWQPTNCEKIFTNPSSNRGLLSAKNSRC